MKLGENEANTVLDNKHHFLEIEVTVTCKITNREYLFKTIFRKGIWDLYTIAQKII